MKILKILQTFTLLVSPICAFHYPMIYPVSYNGGSKPVNNDIFEIVDEPNPKIVSGEKVENIFEIISNWFGVIEDVPEIDGKYY